MSRLPEQHAMRFQCAQIMLLLLAASFATSGCGRQAEGPPTYPVRGVLLIDGKPAKDAQVIFNPADGEDFDQRGARPTGKADENGAFTLTTYQPGDGAPAGTYLVTVYWAANPESLEPSPDRLNGRFADPTRSKLEVVVEEAATELSPFNLRTR